MALENHSGANNIPAKEYCSKVIDDPIESIAGAVFSEDRKQILLVKRRDVPLWVLPGGGIDPDETSEQAVLREIHEETGFDVKLVRLVNIYLPVNRLARVTALYECSILSGRPNVSSETADVRFFPLASLPPMPPPYADWIWDAHFAHPPQIKSLETLRYRFVIHYLLTHPILSLRFLLSRCGIPINSK